MKKLLPSRALKLFSVLALIIGWTTVNAQYCTTGLFSTGCTVGDQILDVSIGSFYHPAGAAPCSPGSFGDFTNDTILLAQGTVNAVTITHGPTYSQGDAIWIDYNDDGDWADAGEHLWSSTGWSLSNSGNITISLTADTGYHRLRVRCNYNGTLSAAQSCANTSYGEVQDYTVYIAPPPACPAPIYGNAQSIGATSAWIHWQSAGTSFNIEYGPAGFTQGTGTVTTSTADSVQLTGLTANTYYDVYLQNNCTSAGNGTSWWSAPVNFKTLCVPVATESEDFDNVPAGSTANPSIPDCWAYWETPGAGGYGYTYSFYNYSSPNSFRMYNYTQTDSLMVISPEITGLDSGKKQITLYGMTYSAGATLKIGTVSGQTEGSTFNEIGTLTMPSPTGTWDEFIIYLDSASGANLGHKHVAIMHGGQGTYQSVYFDDIVIDDIPACPKPVNFTTSFITSSSAVLSWSSTGSAFNMEVGPSGFVQGTGTFIYPNQTTDTVTGLFPNTVYDVYIQNDCQSAGNGTSIWAGPFSFRTNCVGSNTPYFNDFDALTAGQSDPCWDFISVGGTTPAYTEAYLPYSWDALQASSTPNYYRLYTGSATTAAIVTPELTGLDGDTNQIRFKAGHTYFSTTTPVSIIVGTMSDKANFSTFNPVDTILLSKDQWDDYTVPFTNVPAGHGFVAIQKLSTGTFFNIGIEDFHYEVQPVCLPPTGLTAIGTTDSSASFSWTPGVDTLFNIEYGGTGFVQGTGMTVTGVTSISTVVNGLTANTCYDFYVQTDCGSGGTSPWIGPLTMCTNCLPLNMPYSEDFTTWFPNCWDMTGGSQTMLQYIDATTNNAHARGNFWSWSAGNDALMTTGPINISQKAQVKFKWSHQYYTFYPNDQLLLLARPLLSPTWDTLKNLIGTSFNTTGSGFTTPGTFEDELIYLDSATYVGQSAEFRFVANSGWGPDVFIDDFEVEAVPACPDPTQLTATNLQGHSGVASWSSAGGGAFYVEYGPVGFVQGTGGGTLDTTNTNSLLISNLTPVTCYDYYVMADCGGNGTSQWVGPYTFCTTVSCPASTNIQASSITTNDAWIHWNSGASNWDVSYGLSPSTPATGTIMPVTSDSINLTNLQSASTYDLYVRDSCGPGDLSTWTGPFTFTTLCNTFSLNYSETFQGWAAGAALPCWDEGGTMPADRYTAGTNIVTEFKFWSYNSPNYVTWTSPAIDVSQQSRLRFKWSKQYSASYPNDSVYVMVKPTTSGSWDTLAMWGGSTFDCNCSSGTTSPGTFVEDTFALSASYVNQDIQLRFEGVSDWGPNFYLDDVIVEVDPAFASCAAPQALTATNITSTSASLGWTGGSTASWQISYDMGNFSANNGTKVVSTTNPYSLTSLQPSTLYGFYVREICQVGDTSVWSGPFNFQTLCGATPTPWTETFDGTSLPPCWDNYNTTSNTSVNALWRNTSTSWGNYGAQGIVDHTGNNGYAWGVDGSTPTLNNIYLESPIFDVSTTPSPMLKFWLFSNNTTNPGDNNDFYVDVHDGTSWNDSVFWYAGDSAAWKEFEVDLTPYSSGGTISFRFRVDKTASTAFYNDIMVDDVSIEAGSGCVAPSNVMAMNVTCDSATISWVSDTGTIFTSVMYDTSGFNPMLGMGTIVPIAMSPLSIGGLMPGTSYDLYVSDSCADGRGTSMITFTTASAPLPMIAYAAVQSSPHPDTVTVTFDASGSQNGSSYTWDFGSATQSGMMVDRDYAANGTYPVTLTVSNGCGSVDTTFDVTIQGIDIEESALAQSINIYPNPNDGKFNLSFELDSEEKAELMVVNPLGQVIIVKDLGKVKVYQDEIDLSTQAKGMYIIQVKLADGIVSKRVTVQ